MGMGVGGPRRGLLAEINVTPLVDVMLVLLIIFMITASVERIEEQKKKEEDKKEDLLRKVPINLPKVNAKQAVAKTDKKLVLQMTQEMKFLLGGTDLNIGCAPNAKKGQAVVCDETAPQFVACLKALQEKLIHNAKLKEDKEIYLEADKRIPYGCVLRTMEHVRTAGITKFGLVSAPVPTEPEEKKN